MPKTTGDPKLDLLAVRLEMSVAETVQPLREAVARLHQRIDDHMEQEERDYDAIKQELEKLGADVATVTMEASIAKAVAKVTALRAARPEAQKWGGIIGAFLVALTQLAIWAYSKLVEGS